ncbi:molybdopterin-dependent oxidoreductase [Virgibacillus sp. NKC19-3]|nr:molybdopterin-dependent oxidoreductase [Virgibacillus sp. NKC19-3]
MTNNFPDMKNAEVILIAGNNTAECHPLAMRWVLEAQKRGATLIVVDPRFNRTAKVADIYAPIRPGTDIGYLSAIIKYIVDNDLYDETYLREHTNALYKVNPDFHFHDGIFSGYNENGSYDKDSWTYQLDSDGLPLVADSLTDPDCVLMKLKEHFQDYTFEKGSEITGIPAEKLQLIAETFVDKRPGTILYALGMTQKSMGTQGIRMYAMIQLLLGNMGMPGGGINANRGEPNVQGTTDLACMAHILPGYIPIPTDANPTLNDYIQSVGTTLGKQMISLLKAWFGDNATPENEFGYHYLPKRDSTLSSATYVPIFEKLNQDAFKMGFIFGQNPVVSTPTLEMALEGLSKLDLLVVSEIFETETSSFWQHPDFNSKDIKTEVLLLPAASTFEKDGTMTNSSRWIQGKEAVIPTVGESMPDADILYEIMMRLKKRLANSNDSKDEGVLSSTWDYPMMSHGIDMEAVLKEMNGYDLKTSKLLDSSSQIQSREPGTVSSGVGGLYTGVITEEGNHSLRRDNADPSGLGVHPNWTFAWPGNSRVLWNRGSVDKDGKPRDKDRGIVSWNGSSWEGPDVLHIADKDKAPDTPEGSKVFSTGEGKGALFRGVFTMPQQDAPELKLESGYDPNVFKVAPISNEGGIGDGPLPAHYEPLESPVKNPMFSQQSNPTAAPVELPEFQKYGEGKDYPHVLTTYMVTEQFLSGGVTRNTPQLNELMPSNFAEISKSLAKEIGVESGDSVVISTARGEITIEAMVTDRMQTLKIDGRDVEVIGVPWGWGFKGLVTGESINSVTNSGYDPNTGTPEYKACACNVTKGGM